MSELNTNTQSSQNAVSKSVLLTGKCQEDFIVHIYYTEDTNQASDETKKELCIHHGLKWLERQDERFKIALIVDWLDSKGYYISVDISTCYSKFDFNINMGNNKEFNSVYNRSTGTIFYNCKTRKECLIEAIQKVNELFNTKVV